jgi:hypothetical protein
MWLEVPANAAAMAAAQRARGVGLGWVLLALGVCLGALASGYVGAWWLVRPLAAELATRPSVLILDTREALRGLAADQVGAVIARQSALARRLADGGVLVLNSQAVIEAPTGLVVRTGPDAPGQEARP